MAQRLARGRRITILGPAPAPLSRLQGRYRWQLLLKGENRAELHGLCRQLNTEREAGPVKLTVDVDPENML
jgi:primosomal protein N' (replication factor Y)